MTSDPIDQEKLRQAREWAGHFNSHNHPADRIGGAARAAAEVILSLPEPAPTMADIEWDDALHHLAEAEHEVESRMVMLDYMSGPDLIVCHNLDDGQAFRSRRDSLTPTGKKFRLVPENAAPTPDQAPGETSYNPSSEVSADPNPGEAWLVDHKSKYMIRRDAGWVGELGYYSDEFANIAPLRRLVPAQVPKVLRTVDDFTAATPGTAVLIDDTVLTKRLLDGRWSDAYCYVREDHRLAEVGPATVIHTPGGGA